MSEQDAEKALRDSFEAERLWNHPILQQVLEELREDNYKAFRDAPADEAHLMKVKTMSYAIEGFADRLQAKLADAERARFDAMREERLLQEMENARSA